MARKGQKGEASSAGRPGESPWDRVTAQLCRVSLSKHCDLSAPWVSAPQSGELLFSLLVN